MVLLLALLLHALPPLIPRALKGDSPGPCWVCAWPDPDPGGVCACDWLPFCCGSTERFRTHCSQHAPLVAGLSEAEDEDEEDWLAAPLALPLPDPTPVALLMPLRLVATPNQELTPPRLVLGVSFLA